MVMLSVFVATPRISVGKPARLKVLVSGTGWAFPGDHAGASTPMSIPAGKLPHCDGPRVRRCSRPRQRVSRL